ncbi:MAG: hypothetical protein EA425_03605, partial [Puniceicoccaceae bacterium]
MTNQTLAIGAPRMWGNALFINLEVGETFSFLGHEIRLVGLSGPTCHLEVDGEPAALRVARLDLPQVVGGVRVFAADNRIVAGLTPTRESRTHLHGALTKDAFLCLSDPGRPLLDPERFTFPIDRSDGYNWHGSENSHMFAYLHSWRSHEGIDLDLHEARGGERDAVVAMEEARVVWIDTRHTKAREACILLESAADAGVYYAYQHLNAAKLKVEPGQTVRRGQRLGAIWGDNVWGHLHLNVAGYGTCPKDYTEVYGYALNFFPQLYELWHGTLAPRPPPLPSSGRVLFDRHRATTRNRKALHGYRDFLGCGWLLGDWCPADRVEGVNHFEKELDVYDSATNARLRKTLFAGSAGETTNPEDAY